VARVVVDVMLKPEILDPQGQAVANALPSLGVAEVRSVRIGKRIEIEFDGEPDLERAREIADRLLANPVIEDFHLRVEATGSASPAHAAAAEETVPAGDTPATGNSGKFHKADGDDAGDRDVKDAVARTAHAGESAEGGN
jgi:phosphoribosylformylglycinamidine synthase PurS subunit